MAPPFFPIPLRRASRQIAVVGRLKDVSHRGAAARALAPSLHALIDSDASVTASQP
jgi:hypothetical protein